MGFAGTACEDCAPGRYGPTCSSGNFRSCRLIMNKTSFHCFSSSVLVSSVSECSCVHGLCDSGLKGDGRCTCFSQYKGPNCDQGKLLCCCYHHTCTSTCALNPLRLFLSPDTCTFLVSVCYQDPEHPVNPHLSLWELPVPFP